jgi:hypothetical protein
MNICNSPAAPIGCDSPLPLIVIVVILAWAIWIYTHENKEAVK